MQLQLHYTNYTTPHSTTLQLQLQLRYATLHPAVVGEVHCNHCIHSNKHNSNHISVHQWIRSAIRESQQPSSPIGFLFLKLPPPPCAVLLVITTKKLLGCPEVAWPPFLSTNSLKSDRKSSFRLPRWLKVAYPPVENHHEING